MANSATIEAYKNFNTRFLEWLDSFAEAIPAEAETVKNIKDKFEMARKKAAQLPLKTFAEEMTVERRRLVKLGSKEVNPKNEAEKKEIEDARNTFINQEVPKMQLMVALPIGKYWDKEFNNADDRLALFAELAYYVGLANVVDPK